MKTRRRLTLDRRRKLALARAKLSALPLREYRRYSSILSRLERGGTYGAADAALDFILALDARDRKEASDRRTDARRRVLVGARIPRSEAEDCRRAAACEGMSLYAWVRFALMAAAAVSCGRAACCPSLARSPGDGAAVGPPLAP